MKSRVLYRDTLLYNGVLLIKIDRAANALYWINRHGLVKTDTIETEKDGKFDIYENRARGLSCAVPV